LPRPKVLKRLWPTLSALGLGQVIVTNAARVERNYFDTHWLDKEKYVPMLIKGLEQAGGTHLPEVHIRRRLKPLIEDELDDLVPCSVRFVGHPSAEDKLEMGRFGRTDRVLLAVGPEGGWTEFEMNLLADHGFATLSLGVRTLCTHDACVSLVAIATAGARAKG